VTFGELGWLQDEVSCSPDGLLVAGQEIRVSSGWEEAVSEALYRRSYARPRELERDERSPSDFLEALRQSNACRDRYQGGWMVTQAHEDGSVSVERAGLRRRFSPGRYLLPRLRSVVVGDEVVAFVPGSDALSDAYFHAVGGPSVDASDLGHDVRFYINVTASSAPALVSCLTSCLPSFSIAFHFKLLRDPAAYRRADAAVLYVSGRHFQLVHQLLADALDDGRFELVSDTPRLTKTLFPGVGLAEDPPGGESFGMHRCRILSRAVAQARALDGHIDWPRALTLIGEMGVDPDKPYLNHGSVDRYEPQYVSPVDHASPSP
jgi:hypothetical protein